jgi:uncharacterized paraquat-inducible protein A
MPMMFFRSRQPKKGIDGFYRCRTCGMLMNEARFNCDECQRSINRNTLRSMAIATLALLVVFIVFLIVSGSH